MQVYCFRLHHIIRHGYRITNHIIPGVCDDGDIDDDVCKALNSTLFVSLIRSDFSHEILLSMTGRGMSNILYSFLIGT